MLNTSDQPTKRRRARAQFLGCPIDLLTMVETVDIAEDAMRCHRPILHASVNVAKLVKMKWDDELRDSVVGSSLISVDGAGVVLGARLCSIRVPERVAGVDLMYALLALCNKRGYKPFFLGARCEILERAVENVRNTYPDIKIAGYLDGYFDRNDEEKIAELIRCSGADCLFVGMSSPAKERFNKRYFDSMNISFVMGVGGSIDILSGYVKRAPVWVQNLGFEWFYRIVQEPRRMWRRYLVTNCKYVVLLLSEIAMHKFGRHRGRGGR